MRQRGEDTATGTHQPPASPANSAFPPTAHVPRERGAAFVSGRGALRCVPCPRRTRRGAPVRAWPSVPPSLTSAHTTSSSNKCSRWRGTAGVGRVCAAPCRVVCARSLLPASAACHELSRKAIKLTLKRS
ncbi:hypothetical protein B0H10DRAFT_565528 [Mycena sp. CBHHK59/15]|nr:hypothetical protein B0H10DRAFT_565528 [Mycena sp. CBHHK59/15]